MIRPLAYETSFQDFIPVEDFAPSRAFAQAYGFLPFRGMKLDYAAYLGNSPNIASLSSADDANQQTGVDTTNTFLVGGRIGLSYFDDFKIGFSMTYDKTNFFEAANQLIFQSSNKLLLGTNSDFGNVPRKRYGGDLSFRYKNIAFESEIIKVQHDEDIQNADLDRDFFYITLGYRFKERLFVYASYWDVRLDYTVATVLKDEVQVFVVDGDIILPNFGIAYSVNDRITLKAHIARADLAEDIPFLELFEKDKFYHLNAAISIFFEDIMLKKTIIAMAMCLLSAKIASAQVAVIAHKDVPVDTIKRSDLLNLYTLDIKSWNNGTSVIVFDLKEKSDEKEMFYEYLGKTTSRMKLIWMKKLLSGEGNKPEALANDDEMLKKVASTPGAIGFVPQNKLKQDVKMLLVINKEE